MKLGLRTNIAIEIWKALPTTVKFAFAANGKGPWSLTLGDLRGMRLVKT